MKEKMVISEYDEQCLVVDYCRLKGIICFAIPNGGFRLKREAKRLQRSGVVAGIPDLCIPYSRQNYGALFIEMKSKAGRLNVVQRFMIEKLKSAGNLALVAYGFDEARGIIDDYFMRSVCS